MMTDFAEKMRLKGRAEENLYFAELDKKLIKALREKQAKKSTKEEEQPDKMKKQENKEGTKS